jgi:hypothetical protein
MESILKNVLFWVLRFFDCLFSKRYWKEVIFKEVKSFLKQIFSICFWTKMIMGVFFVIVTICTIIICIIPGIVLFLLDKIKLKPFLFKLTQQC